MRGRLAWCRCVVSVAIAATVATSLAMAVCSRSGHRFMREACKVAHYAPWFGQPSPRLATRSDRPDYPPPVLPITGGRTGWMQEGPVVALCMCTVHACVCAGVILAYARFGRPRRWGRIRMGQSEVWRRVLSRSAWASLMWPAAGVAAWSGWYWAHMAYRAKALQTPSIWIDAPTILMVLGGAGLAYVFTVAAVTRREVVKVASGPPLRCLGCDYELVGLPTRQCPECSWTASSEDERIFAIGRGFARLQAKGWGRRLGLARALLVVALICSPRSVLIISTPFPNRWFDRIAWVLYRVSVPVVEALRLGPPLSRVEHDSPFEDVIGVRSYHPDP